MDKRRWHHIWTKFRGVKPGYFLVLTVVCAVVCVFSLRANNEHMVKLRQAVYAADQNNGNVEGALQQLQAYVTTHMNTNLSTNTSVYPPIQLKYTYDRLIQAESTQVAQTNTALYTAAQVYCQKLDPVDFSGHNRVPCIESYVTSHGATLPAIPDALYKFDFVTPIWSPDLAGWSIVATAVSALLFIASFVLRRLFKSYVTS
jgi:hypothetical protein